MTKITTLQEAQALATQQAAQAKCEIRVWHDAKIGEYFVLPYNKLPPTPACECVAKVAEGKFLGKRA